MVVTREDLHDLKEKLAQIERELIEVRRVLEQLTAAPEPRAEAGLRAAIRWVDRTGWQEWFDAWFQHIGMTTQPVGAEQLQAIMRQEGVRPEENLLSCGIIAMREEYGSHALLLPGC